VIPGGDLLLLVAAGVLAGLVGTAGGITSLISYPALLLAGLPAFAANVANIVAVVACWPGAALASRPELQGQGRWLERWIPVAALGGAAGSALLLSTPPSAFARIVPFLVAAGALALLAQPWLTRGHPHRGAFRGTRLALAVGLAGISLYNGYFGAGSGVMTLALLMVTLEPRLPTANALKNMLVGGASLTSAVIFAAAGPVRWSAVGCLAAGMFAGSTLGPHLTRRMPAGPMRWAVAAVGIGLAIELWLHPST
jgi:uncharacterized membrane protein YfcA